MSKNNIEINLSIADVVFAITAEKGINLRLAQRHIAFQLNKQDNNFSGEKVRLRFCHNLPDPDTSPVKIWEVTGDSPSWKVFDYHDESRIFLYNDSEEETIIISLKPGKYDQEIFIKAPPSGNVEVLKYPMDIILMYYLSMKFSLLIVHASGFSIRNFGHVCIGKSGAGKSTLYNLAAQAGGSVVQDDRLILRQTRQGWFMYPLPLSEKDHPVREKVCRLNSLFHGPRNLAIPLTGTVRLNQFLPHIVHFPNWKGNYLNQLNLVGDLLRTIRIFHFFFIPDITAIQYLQNGKDPGKSHNIPPEKPLPSTTKGFRQQHDTFYLPG